jgi:hypothetical protein
MQSMRCVQKVIGLYDVSDLWFQALPGIILLEALPRLFLRCRFGFARQEPPYVAFQAEPGTRKLGLVTRGDAPGYDE